MEGEIKINVEELNEAITILLNTYKREITNIMIPIIDKEFDILKVSKYKKLENSIQSFYDKFPKTQIVYNIDYIIKCMDELLETYEYYDKNILTPLIRFAGCDHPCEHLMATEKAFQYLMDTIMKYLIPEYIIKDCRYVLGYDSTQDIYSDFTICRVNSDTPMKTKEFIECVNNIL